MHSSPLKTPSSADLRVAITACRLHHAGIYDMDAARRVADWLDAQVARQNRKAGQQAAARVAAAQHPRLCKRASPLWRGQ